MAYYTSGYGTDETLIESSWKLVPCWNTVCVCVCVITCTIH